METIFQRTGNKRVKHIFGLSLLLAIAAGVASANQNVQVNVTDANNNPVAGAQVVALFFNNGQPDPTNSVLGFAGPDGKAYLNVVPAVPYIIIASSQNYTPTFVDQMSNGPQAVVAGTPSNTPPYTQVSITLAAGASGVGEIDVPFTGATSNSVLFGQVSLQSGGGASAYGMAQTGGGGGTIRFLNVTNAPGGTYQVSANDPKANNGVGANASVPIGADLNSATLTLPANSFSFAAAPPPVANLSQTQQSGQGGNLSLTGVVRDGNGSPIPFIGLNFQSAFKDPYGQTHNDWRGAMTDQNGTFQLYDLQPNTTYYTNASGGCQPNTNVCYQGSQSTASAQGNFSAAPGINDFLFVSSNTTPSPTIVLQQAPPGTGVMAIYVKDQLGHNFPQAGVGLWPDGMPWQTTGGPNCAPFGAAYNSNPGFKNVNTQAATGYALITGLPSGNYQVNVWTPYGQVNFNGTMNSQGQPPSPGSTPCGVPGSPASSSALNEYRVTIDTSAAHGMVGIYDIYGDLVSSGPAMTVTVTIATGASTGEIKGVLSFPAAQNDLSQSPITIVVNPNCSGNGPCVGGAFTSFSDANTPQTVNYSIPVSSGQSYNVNVLSNYWGAVFAGGNQPSPDLSASTSVVMNIQFGKAGRLLGNLRKPDGSIFVPAGGNNNSPPWINAEGNNSWGGNQLSTDGSFTIGGLLPGTYTLAAQNNGGGSFPYTAKSPAPQIIINALQDTNADLNLVDAVTVVPVVDLTKLPALALPQCNQQQNHSECPVHNWKIYALPQGTPFTSPVASNLIANSGPSGANVFAYSPSTGNYSNCNGGGLSAPGFCSSAIPASKAGTGFDFYLMRTGSFDSVSGARPYFVIENSSSIIVGPKLAVNTLVTQMGPSASTATVEDIVLTPANDMSHTQQAVLSGTVTAVNMINARQFQALGGDFNKFLGYLPLVWAYDSSGTLKGTGLVVPDPRVEATVDTQLNQAVANGDFNTFHNLTSNLGWGAMGYEIRGLTAGQTYNLIVTTPNYPPFKTSVTLGVAGSTTSVNANLDLNPGDALSGVVQSTTTAAIAGAQVTVKAPGYAATTLTTDVNGAWSLNGLAAGTYQVSAVAAGYAQLAEVVEVNASAVTAQTFSLPASNASITGSVYTNNPVCPPGASCSAFGKTVLQGITVLAYDDTVNVNDPSSLLPLYRAITDSSGVYRLDGLLSGDVYKLFVNAPGYFVSIATAGAVAGVLPGVDFSLKPKPLDVNVFGHVVGGNYEFQITNYTRFSGGKAWTSPAPFVSTTAATLIADSSSGLGFVERPDASGVMQLFIDTPTASLASGVGYVLHIEAQPNDPRAPIVVKEVAFGLNLPNGTCQAVDQALIGDDSGVNAQGLPNNQVPLDISGNGNGSGLGLPAGSVLPSVSTAIPSMCMSQANVSSATVGTSALHAKGVSLAAFLSGVYSVSLSSVSHNPKGVDLTLSYNQTGTDITDAAIFYYDSTSLQWKSVPGVQTIDPVRGTITVKGLKTLASVLDVQKAQSLGLMSVTDGRSYRPRASSSVDSGQFAILAPSQVTSGGSFAGTTVKIFNFPNPFSLQTKTVSTVSGVCPNAAQNITTDGTVIKYEIPAGISGAGVIRIYTPSGRLVREIDAGAISPSTCYYQTWDGKNRDGVQVADGVYYGILSVGGSKQSSGTFKLAVIK
jgi:hypothetical protein